MKTKIALTQFAASDVPSENLSRQIEMIRCAAAGGAKIICTQELFMSKYFCLSLDEKFFALAEKIPSQTTDALSALAKELEIVIVASLFENRGNEVCHNTSVVFDSDGTLLGKYRKMHIPHDPCFEEKYYFTPGDCGYPVWDTAFGKIAVLICWDQWFPEAARIAALGGAEIIFYPTAIGVLPTETSEEKEKFRAAWQTVQCGHAVANGAYVAAANRVGTETQDGRSVKFWGSSFIANPYGKICACASEDEDEILISEVDFDEVAKFRKTWPFFRDRRVDSYGSISQLGR